MRTLATLTLALLLLVATPRQAAAQSLAPRPYDCEQSKLRGRFFYLCLGGVRGRKGLISELTLRRKRSLRTEVRLAARLNYTTAIPALRQLFDKPPRVWLLGEIAQALADLKDTKSVTRIARALPRYEKNWSSLYTSLFRALVQLSPAAAGRYCRGLARRLKTIRTTWARDKVRKILPVFISQRARGMLPLLRRWTGRRRITTNRVYALLMNARMRLGERKLLRYYRRYLGTRHAAVPVNPEHYIGGLGDSPADIPALVRFAGASSPEGRQAYNAIDRLLDRLPKLPARVRRAATVALIRGLGRLTKYRENRRRRFGFSYSLLARHHAALTRLRLLASRKRLLQLMLWGPDTATAWVATERGLALKIPTTHKLATGLMARSVTKFAPGVLRKYKRRLIRRAAATMGKKHGGWALMLLDRNANERHLALYHFSRHKPPGACNTVTAAISLASEDAVHDGLVALSLLGNRCQPQLERLARDARLRPAVRGTAAEVLAMMKAPSLPGILRLLQRVTNRRTAFRLRPYIARARQIAR